MQPTRQLAITTANVNSHGALKTLVEQGVFTAQVLCVEELGISPDAVNDLERFLVAAPLELSPTPTLAFFHPTRIAATLDNSPPCKAADADGVVTEAVRRAPLRC